jgi:hypothetical protein
MVIRDFHFHLCFLQGNILDEMERLKLFSFWAISHQRWRRAHRNVHNKMVIGDFHFSSLFFSMKYFGWNGEIKIIFYGFAPLTSKKCS